MITGSLERGSVFVMRSVIFGQREGIGHDLLGTTQVEVPQIDPIGSS